nr:protein disulfide-isomerase-like [Rhipicephalus microplus]
MFSPRLLGLLCCLAAANCTEYDVEDQVLVLNGSNFDMAIKEHKHVFVMFYSPLTVDYHALSSVYAKTAKQLVEEGSDVKLAKVNTMYDHQLFWHYARGLPTLTFFRDGQPAEYKRDHTVEEMTQWIKKKVQPPAQLLTTVDDARAFVDSANVTVVGFFKDQTSVEAKEFLKAAYTIEEHAFAITSEDAVYKELGASKDGVVLFKKFDEGRNVLALKPTCDRIRTFVAVNSLPLVSDLTKENYKDLINVPVRQYSILFYSKDSGDMTEVLENFRETAAAFRYKVVFVTIDVDQEDVRMIVSYFFMGKRDVPALRFANLERPQYAIRFKPETNSLEAEDIKSFVQGVLDGTIKDEPLLPGQGDFESQSAQVVVQENFDEVVFDKTKNVLVLFYTPWSIRCFAMTVICDRLAPEYKDRKDLLIAKMDVTTNENEHTEIHSFPTWRLYKKETNEVVEFNGEQTEEGLRAFIDITCGDAHPAGVEDEKEEKEEKEANEERDKENKRDEL